MISVKSPLSPAFPTGNNDRPENSILRFGYDSGVTARLDCPITPGALRSQYYVIWRNAANHGMVFYRTFPPDSSASDVMLSDRYTIDNQNFSLYISQVTPGDMRFEYQCLLGVEDPQNPTTPDITYVYAGTLNLTLSILSKWLINFSTGIRDYNSALPASKIS